MTVYLLGARVDFDSLKAVLEGRVDLAAPLIMSLPNNGNRSFANRLSIAVVAVPSIRINAGRST